MSISSLHPTIETASTRTAPVRTTKTDSAVWILSAVTPPKTPTFLDDQGDEQWYIRIIDEFLRETISTEKEIPVLVRDAIDTAGELYVTRTPDDVQISPEELPSAMCSCVRLDEDAGEIEYFTLGDGAIWAQSEDHSARICASEGSLHREDYDPDDQWRLSFSPESIEYARHGYLPYSEYRTIVIGTSAIDLAIEEYDVFDSWRAFTDRVAGAGTRGAIREVSDFLQRENVELPRCNSEKDIGAAAMFQFS